MASFTCSRCGAVHSVPVLSRVNTAENPELKEEVRSGRLFVWTCPQCGAPNLIRSPFLYHDPALRLMVFLSDGDSEAQQRLAETLRTEEGLKDYTLRLVDSVGELVEKIGIAEAGLDDVALELCKYVTLQELGREVDLRFYRLEGADNDIILAYPQDGQMQMLRVGFMKTARESSRATLSSKKKPPDWSVWTAGGSLNSSVSRYLISRAPSEMTTS